MSHSESSDHQVWNELVAIKSPFPSLKRLAINKYSESLVEDLLEIAPDLEAERDEILRQQPMTD